MKGLGQTQASQDTSLPMLLNVFCHKKCHKKEEYIWFMGRD